MAEEDHKEEHKEEQTEEHKRYEPPPVIGKARKFLGYAILGYVSGYAVKKIGKFMIIFIGGSIVALEVLGYHSYVEQSYEAVVEHAPTVWESVWRKLRGVFLYSRQHMLEYGGFFSGAAAALLL